MTVLTGEAGFAFMQMISRKGALRMEMAGLKRRGRSAYSICKSEYGLKGNRQSVYDQMCVMVEKAIVTREEEMNG